MGADPATSVVGPEGRLWDVDNVLVADSSVFADLGRLQPDAHDHGPGRPGRPACCSATRSPDRAPPLTQAVPESVRPRVAD